MTRPAIHRVVPKPYDAVEKVGFGADFSGVTVVFGAQSAFKRNATDDGPTTADRVAVRCTPAAHALAPGPSVALGERGPAVPPGGDGSEPQTAGAIPRAAAARV